MRVSTSTGRAEIGELFVSLSVEPLVRLLDFVFFMLLELNEIETFPPTNWGFC
jgi:hypothetical protein